MINLILIKLNVLNIRLVVQNEYMFSLVQSTNFALQNNQVIQKIKVQHDK